MKAREGRCSCGQLRIVCSGEPVSVSLCHCRDCQRRTGSAYGVAAFFARDDVQVSGRFSDYERPSDSGYRVLHHFCPDCGGTVFWEPGRKPDMVAVAVGAFADPDFPAPTQDVYRQHRHRWVSVPG